MVVENEKVSNGEALRNLEMRNRVADAARERMVEDAG